MGAGPSVRLGSTQFLKGQGKAHPTLNPHALQRLKGQLEPSLGAMKGSRAAHLRGKELRMLRIMARRAALLSALVVVATARLSTPKTRQLTGGDSFPKSVSLSGRGVFSMALPRRVSSPPPGLDTPVIAAQAGSASLDPASAVILSRVAEEDPDMAALLEEDFSKLREGEEARKMPSYRSLHPLSFVREAHPEKEEGLAAAYFSTLNLLQRKDQEQASLVKRPQRKVRRNPELVALREQQKWAQEVPGYLEALNNYNKMFRGKETL